MGGQAEILLLLREWDGEGVKDAMVFVAGNGMEFCRRECDHMRSHLRRIRRDRSRVERASLVYETGSASASVQRDERFCNHLSSGLEGGSCLVGCRNISRVRSRYKDFCSLRSS